jgi:hypothetical protein
MYPSIRLIAEAVEYCRHCRIAKIHDVVSFSVPSSALRWPPVRRVVASWPPDRCR